MEFDLAKIQDALRFIDWNMTWLKPNTLKYIGIEFDLTKFKQALKVVDWNIDLVKTQKTLKLMAWNLTWRFCQAKFHSINLRVLGVLARSNSMTSI